MNLEETVSHLNKLLHLYPDQMNELLNFRVEVESTEYVDDSPFQFLTISDKCMLGPLGLLNGVFGGKIIMGFNTETGDIIEFITKEEYYRRGYDELAI